MLECERAIEQAKRFFDTGERTPEGQGWETCFRTLFKSALTGRRPADEPSGAAPARVPDAVRRLPGRWETTAKLAEDRGISSLWCDATRCRAVELRVALGTVEPEVGSGTESPAELCKRSEDFINDWAGKRTETGLLLYDLMACIERLTPPAAPDVSVPDEPVSAADGSAFAESEDEHGAALYMPPSGQPCCVHLCNSPAVMYGLDPNNDPAHFCEKHRDLAEEIPAPAAPEPDGAAASGGDAAAARPDAVCAAAEMAAAVREAKAWCEDPDDLDGVPHVCNLVEAFSALRPESEVRASERKWCAKECRRIAKEYGKYSGADNRVGAGAAFECETTITEKKEGP